MNIHEIAKALIDKFGIDGLECIDKKITVTIDDTAVLIEETDDGVYLLLGFVGDPPSERGDVLANIFLETNFALMRTKSATLTRNPETGAYVLIERLETTYDFESFCKYLEKFADTLDTWHTMLENFCSAAAEAPVTVEQEVELKNALQQGFLLA